jgi:hypothetical protein
MTAPVITGPQAKAIREHLGLTLDAFGRMLGYEGSYVANHMSAMEGGRQPIRYEIGHLMLAIALGYRPVEAKAVLKEIGAKVPRKKKAGA